MTVHDTAPLLPSRRRKWPRMILASLALGVVGLGGGWLVGMASNAFTTPPKPSVSYAAPYAFATSAASSPPSVVTTPRTPPVAPRVAAPKPPAPTTTRVLIIPRLVDVTAAPAPSAAPSTSPNSGDLNCSDFRYQEDAQAAMRPGDPDHLDRDHDGQACQNLPHRQPSSPSASTTARASATSKPRGSAT